jgi:hypothetical protein
MGAPVLFRPETEKKWNAEIRVTSHNLKMFSEHPILNISSGGMFARAAQSPPVGAQVSMRFTFDADKRQVQVRAIVVKDPKPALGDGTALVFEGLNPDDRKYIESLLAKAS